MFSRTNRFYAFAVFLFSFLFNSVPAFGQDSSLNISINTVVTAPDPSLHVGIIPYKDKEGVAISDCPVREDDTDKVFTSSPLNNQDSWFSHTVAGIWRVGIYRNNLLLPDTCEVFDIKPGETVVYDVDQILPKPVEAAPPPIPAPPTNVTPVAIHQPNTIHGGAGVFFLVTLNGKDRLAIWNAGLFLDYYPAQLGDVKLAVSLYPSMGQDKMSQALTWDVSAAAGGMTSTQVGQNQVNFVLQVAGGIGSVPLTCSYNKEAITADELDAVCGSGQPGFSNLQLRPYFGPVVRIHLGWRSIHAGLWASAEIFPLPKTMPTTLRFPGSTTTYDVDASVDEPWAAVFKAGPEVHVNW